MLLFGTSKIAFYSYCFWGWPLMVFSLRGGVLGLLALPSGLLATLWGVNHLHLILSYGFIVRSFEALGYPFGRVTGLVLGGIYIFFIAPMEDSTKGTISCCFHIHIGR